MAEAPQVLRVEGLREVQRALRQVDTDLPKQLKGRMKTIASRVTDIIRGRLPRLSGLMVNKTQPHATTKGAGISWRGVPYAAVTEFGGWPEGREYIAKGRYIFPTVEAEESRIEQDLEQVLNDIIQQAGL